MSRSALRSVSILFVAVLVGAPTAQAQPNPTPPADSISTQTLARVAKAATKVEAVRRRYDKKVRNVYKQAQKRSLRLEMLLKIDRILVKIDGLSPERYEEVMAKAESDDELKEKIQKMAKKHRRSE